jgi:hypothetical protein
LQDKLDADDDLMLQAQAKAEKAINHDIRVGVAKGRGNGFYGEYA